MNVKLYGYYNAPDLWIDYSEFDGEFSINCIYSGSDPERVDITDFLSDRVLAHAEQRMVEDWHECAIDRAEYILEDR